MDGVAHTYKMNNGVSEYIDYIRGYDGTLISPVILCLERLYTKTLMMYLVFY